MTPENVRGKQTKQAVESSLIAKLTWKSTSADKMSSGGRQDGLQPGQVLSLSPRVSLDSVQSEVQRQKW